MRKYNARDRVFLSLSVIVFLAAASFANAQSCPVFRMTPDALKAWHNPHPSRSDFLLPLPMGLSLVFNPISLRTSNLYGDDATTTYTMGSSERRVFETNLRVRVGSPIQDARGEGVLLIGKYEVTKGQYAAVMGSGDLRRGLSILRDKTIETRTDDLLDEYLNPRSKCFGKVTRELHVLLSEPLTFLSYRDYIEFLDRLNLQCIERQDCSLKLKSLGSNDDVLGFVRLPLEHEWEYVARGGAEYIAGRITEAELQSDLPSLPSSDRITAYAHVGNDPERVVSIGSRKPLYGFYDLYGNAQELMGNVFTAENGFGAVGGYVARGGHYALNADELRASRRIELRVFRRDDRDGSLQIQYFPNTGLRLAMGFPIEDAANAGFGDREAPDAVGDQAGNTLAEARDLGLVSGTAIETREELTQSDSDDWYKVRLANYSQLKIRLLQQGSLNFALVDASGDVIERPNAQGSLTSAPLLPGEYWLRVSTPNQLTSNVDYLAQIERELVPDTGLSRPDPSELARSVSVGSRGTIFEKGFVGTGDAIDTFPVENASRLGGISAKIESKSKLTVRVLDAQHCSRTCSGRCKSWRRVDRVAPTVAKGLRSDRGSERNTGSLCTGVETEEPL